MGSSFGWRTPFLVLAVLSMLFVLASAIWLDPSPRWLILRGRQSEVRAAWDTLGVGHTEREKAEREMQPSAGDMNTTSMLSSSTREETSPPMRTSSTNGQRSVLDIFAKDVRSRTGLAIFLLAMQQLSGIDGVLYVSNFRSTEPSTLDQVCNDKTDDF